MLFKVHSFTDFIWMLFWNALAIALLHIVVLYFCVKLSPKSLDFNRPRFAPKKWEHDGRFYRDKLKINIWKDYMPQYVGKDGFGRIFSRNLPWRMVSLCLFNRYLVPAAGESGFVRHCIFFPDVCGTQCLHCDPTVQPIPFVDPAQKVDSRCQTAI